MGSLYNHVSAAANNACSRIHIPGTPAATVTKMLLPCRFPDCNGSFSKEDSRKMHYWNIHNWSASKQEFMDNGRPKYGRVCKPRKLKQPKVSKKAAKLMAQEIQNNPGIHKT